MGICDNCPIFKDGYRSTRMCSHLECWQESEYEKITAKVKK